MVLVFGGVAALIHVYVFSLESLFWGRPKTNRIFGVTPEAAEHCRLFAFNQGFYNLFLAGAVGIGLFLGGPTGRALVAYGLASMLLAGIVLLCSNPRLFRAALIQGLPPLLGLVFLAFGGSGR